ncbi:hypothetical protein PAPYR_4230 [Paratrimastix pyriformis]|uniref:Uncharacterized protein n=1 Tax=Paratrimastix pyriformis TaxID=342808 RepID=A0ABQ8USV1_9EUKA|nr:hypothetical protein PAPYR_4230 [Paratrimastix pyriformis]
MASPAKADEVTSAPIGDPVAAVVSGPTNLDALKALVEKFRSDPECEPLTAPVFIQTLSRILGSYQGEETLPKEETEPEKIAILSAQLQCMWLATRPLANRMVFAAEGFIPKLCTLLRTYLHTPALVTPLARILSNLGTNETEELQTLLAQEEVPTVMVDAFRVHMENVDAVEIIAYCLQNLSSHPTVKNILLAAGIPALLADALRRHQREPRLLIPLCGAIQNICWDDVDNRHAMGSVGLVPLVVEALRAHLAGNPQKEVVTALWSAAEHLREECPPNEEAFQACGGLMTFFQAIQQLQLLGNAGPIVMDDEEEVDEKKKDKDEEDSATATTTTDAAAATTTVTTTGGEAATTVSPPTAPGETETEEGNGEPCPTCAHTS